MTTIVCELTDGRAILTREGQTPGSAWRSGPVFDSKAQAESFLSFISHVNVSALDWDDANSGGHRLLKMWVEEGQKPRREARQFTGRWLDRDLDDDYQWSFTCDMVEECFPLFLTVTRGNNSVADILRKHGVIDDTMLCDPENGCFYAYFRTREQGRQFLQRLNRFLRNNWSRGYE